jgi:hypothetical protein
MTVSPINLIRKRTPFYFLCLGLLITLWPAGRCSAQGSTHDNVTLDVHKTTMDTVLLLVEQQTGHRFFYDTADLDTNRITLKVDQQPYTQVLSQIFSGTDLNYSVDRDGHVFVIKGEPIATDLPGAFFEKAPKGVVATTDTVRDYLEEAGKKPVSTIENKLFVIGDKTLGPPPRGIANLVGYARDAKTGEPIVGASIYIDNPRIGAFSDRYGYYSLSLPKGRHTLNIQSIGMYDTRRLIMVYGDGKLNIDLIEQVITLKRVIVSAEKVSNVKRTEMGVQKLDIKQIKQVPVVFGEADVMRVVMTLPGVKTVGESSTGLNVRGGSADQNLVLFNEATIYNTAHFFGMFSVFNPEIVKDVELYKSSIPARFGGRLSSVLDISSREE